jgi:hypothetical protein
MPSDPVRGCFGGSIKTPKVRSYLLDEAGAATGNPSHLTISERLTEDHVSSLLMLGERKIRRQVQQILMATKRRVQRA